jgi:hypothetical protein
MTEKQKDLLLEVYDYFDQRADADYDGERYRGNEAMRFKVDLYLAFPEVDFHGVAE